MKQLPKSGPAWMEYSGMTVQYSLPSGKRIITFAAEKT
jgi:hypothetical protein